MVCGDGANSLANVTAGGAPLFNARFEGVERSGEGLRVKSEGSRIDIELEPPSGEARKSVLNELPLLIGRSAWRKARRRNRPRMPTTRLNPSCTAGRSSYPSSCRSSRFQGACRAIAIVPAYIAFQEEPSMGKRIETDIHCVTRWSRLDIDFEGVPIQVILERAQLRPSARYVLAHAEQGYAELGAGLQYRLTRSFHITADLRAGARQSKEDVAYMSAVPVADFEKEEHFSRARIGALLYF